MCVCVRVCTKHLDHIGEYRLKCPSKQCDNRNKSYVNHVIVDFSGSDLDQICFGDSQCQLLKPTKTHKNEKPVVGVFHVFRKIVDIISTVVEQRMPA